MAIAVGIMASVMPQEWYDRMNTINTYQEDQSVKGRINAWHTAFNVAKDRITGGDLKCGGPRFQPVRARSVKRPRRTQHLFRANGRAGIYRLRLVMLLGLMAWVRAQQIIKRCKKDPDKKWASDLAAMTQVSLIGYAAAEPSLA